MKLLILAAASLALSMSVASAGSKGNGSDASANAGATSSSNSASGAQAASGSYSGDSTSNAALQINNTYESGGTSTLKNVPAVSAPSVFGGGHPCLAGQSAGIAVAGFGGTYGQGTAETVCMLYVMGQPEAAIRALVMTDRVACKALSNVGYYRIGKSVVPFKCDKTVAGGIDTPGATFRRTKVSSRSTVHVSASYGERPAPTR